jgi:hypothetical protein
MCIQMLSPNSRRYERRCRNPELPLEMSILEEHQLLVAPALLI